MLLVGACESCRKLNFRDPGEKLASSVSSLPARASKSYNGLDALSLHYEGDLRVRAVMLDGRGSLRYWLHATRDRQERTIDQQGSLTKWDAVGPYGGYGLLQSRKFFRADE